MNLLVQAHFLGWDAMLRVDAGQRDLVLPQLNAPEIVGFSRGVWMVNGLGVVRGFRKKRNGEL